MLLKVPNYVINLSYQMKRSFESGHQKRKKKPREKEVAAANKNLQNSLHLLITSHPIKIFKK